MEVDYPLEEIDEDFSIDKVREIFIKVTKAKRQAAQKLTYVYLIVISQKY